MLVRRSRRFLIVCQLRVWLLPQPVLFRFVCRWAGHLRGGVRFTKTSVHYFAWSPCIYCIPAAGIYDQRRYNSSSGRQRDDEEAALQEQQQQHHPMQLLSLAAPDPPLGNAGTAAAFAAAAAAAAAGDDLLGYQQQQQHYPGYHAGGHQTSRRHAAAAVAAAAAAAAIPPDPGQPGIAAEAHFGPPAAAAAAAAGGDIGCLEEEDGGGGVQDSYVVECPCGIQYDDGHLMIECEYCKSWAHTACLQAQMVSADPTRKSHRTVCSTVRSFTNCAQLYGCSCSAAWPIGVPCKQSCVRQLSSPERELIQG